MWIRKLQIKIILISALFLACVQPTFGIERLGYVGQTFSFPVFLSPTRSYDEVTYHLDMGYFVSEKWAASWSLDAQLAGQQIFLLELGPDWYPLQDVIVLPWISARFLYTMLPSNDIGWLSQIGIETHISRSSELENFRLRVSSGVGQLFFDTSDTFFLETARVGLIWSF